jgi:hypothetical protein
MHQVDIGFAAVAGSAAKARAKAREADWRRQLARAFVYASGRSPAQADELLAEYERREREGPDFMRIRPQSVIAPLVTLDRNERIRLLGKFRALSRRSWVAKENGKHRQFSPLISEYDDHLNGKDRHKRANIELHRCKRKLWEIPPCSNESLQKPSPPAGLKCAGRRRTKTRLLRGLKD